jgi:hypothetical protein
MDQHNPARRGCYTACDGLSILKLVDMLSKAAAKICRFVLGDNVLSAKTL